MNARLLLASCAMVLTAAPGVRGQVLTILPSVPRVEVHQPFDVVLRFDDRGPTAIGAYDITVTYDRNLATYVDAVFGDPDMGNQLDFSGIGSTRGVRTDTPGELNVFEVSLDAPEELTGSQADSFVIATLRFQSIAPGNSGLDLTVLGLSGAVGEPLVAQTVNGTFEVVAVPESGLWGMLASLGLAGYVCRRQLAEYRRVEVPAPR